MHRIDGAGHVGNRFVVEDPATNRPPTEVTADILNALQEELAGFIEWAGLVLNKADDSQLKQGLLAKFATLIGVQNSSYTVAAAAGSADAITATYIPPITSLTNGMTLSIRSGLANATTTPTFTPSSGTIAAKTIVKGSNLALVAGDITGWPDFKYDSTLDKWVLLNPATGTATVTATNDSSFVDNSVKAASTSWIRGAMSNIATAAGFAASLTSSGYIKLPAWLAGWVVQWGSSFVSAAPGAASTVSFPIAFPTSCLGLVVSNSNGSSSGVMSSNSPSTTGFTGYCSIANLQLSFIAIGK